MHARTTFAPLPETPSLARHFIRTVLADHCDTHTIYAAELMVSELVTNAVVHAVSDVEVQVESSPRRTRIEISDEGVEWVLTAGIRDDAAERGRGLTIVAACALRWGRHLSDGRTTVWFEVRGLGRDRERAERPGATSELEAG